MVSSPQGDVTASMPIGIRAVTRRLKSALGATAPGSSAQYPWLSDGTPVNAIRHDHFRQVTAAARALVDSSFSG